MCFERVYKPRLFKVLLELPVNLAQRVIWDIAVKVSWLASLANHEIFSPFVPD